MKRILIYCLLVVSGFFIMGGETVLAAKDKKALVAVSFGTTFEESRRLDIEAVEGALQKAFPDRDFKRAFTAKIVIKRMFENEGVKVDDLETVLANLQKQGYNDILIQSTHLTPGEEFNNKIMAVVDNYKNKFAKISVGRPLLTEAQDYDVAAIALQTQLPVLEKDEVVVFMGHGSPNIHNPSYNLLQESFDKMGIPAVIGVVEETDHPNYEDMLAKLKSTKAKKVMLIPLMLVSGDHANNDMIGEEEDSWANMLRAEGYSIRSDMRGTGRNAAIQNIYVMHALEALAK